MLEFSGESQAQRRQLRQCPVGNSLDDFAPWLYVSGYKQRPAQLLLRGAAHVGHWTSEQSVPLEHIDDERIDTFVRHLSTWVCRHGFQGREPSHRDGARRVLGHLHTGGMVLPRVVEPVPSAPVAKRFRDWMCHHRGVTAGTLGVDLPLVQEFLATVGDDTSTYDASQGRTFLLAVSRRHGQSRPRSPVHAVRMFLRGLAAYGYCAADLVGAVPRIAKWRRASLPRSIDAADIERLLGTCDPHDAAGSRDRAIILLLARLG